MNPLALMVKAPNIGGIVAQNEAAQAQVNDNALVRQLNLAKVQAAQQQLIKQQQLSDLFKTGKIDPYSEQGIAQIASIDAEAAKPYMDLYSEKLKNTREDAKLGFQEKELGFKERETNAKIANYGNQADYRNAQIGISRAQLAARQNELRSSIGEKETKAFMEVNALVAAAPPEQQAAVAQQAMQLLQNRFPNGQFSKFNANEDLADMVALGTALNNKNAKSGTTVNINQSGKYLDELGKGSAQQDLSAIDAAKKAPDQIKTAQSVIDIVNQGKAITGTGAEARVNIAKAFATAGLISGESVAATAQLQASLARQTLDSIKSSNLGAGQGFSNADREFLEKATAGGIKLTGGSIIKIAELNKKAAAASYAKGQEAINRISKTEGGAAALGGYQLPELSTTPQGGMQQAPQAGGQAPQGVISFEDYMGQQ